MTHEATGCGAEFLPGTECSYDHLRTYEKAWTRHYGKQQVRSYALKESLIDFSDGFINKVAGSVTAQKGKRWSVVKIFLEAFSHRPVLMYKAFRLFRG